MSASDDTPLEAVEAVVFDLDGTLVDSERLLIDAGVAALETLGLAPRRDLLVAMVGSVNDDAIRALADAYAGFDHPAFDAAWAEAARAGHAGPMPRRPGALRLLRWLAAQGIPVAVASNSTTDKVHRKLASSGLAAHIPAHLVLGRDRVAAPKPAPDLFLAAARALGVDPAHCLAFEDSDPGVEAALAAEMRVVHVPDQRPPGDVRATRVAPSLIDGARAFGLAVPHSEEDAE